MPLSLPKVYPITDTKASGMDHAEQVKRFIEGGATLIQLRDKDASSREFFDAVKECVEYARPRGVRIIINDRVDIAITAGADGVHLGQDDLPPESARDLLGERAIIGYSTHSVQQAISAAKLPVDYVAIGPIFATGTKADAEPVVGLKAIRDVRRAIGATPIVAIGGIDEQNIAEVIAAGADSAAVISALVSREAEIAATLTRLLNNV